MSKVVEKALYKEPNRRYSNVLEFSEAFKQAAANNHDNRTTFVTDIQDMDEDRPTRRIPFRKQWKTIESKLSAPNLYCRNGDYLHQAITIPHEGLRMGRSSQNQLVLEKKVFQECTR